MRARMRAKSEMLSQLRKALEHQQPAIARGLANFFVLQDPRLRMRNKHCVDSRRQCWIDVRFRAVADHPRRTLGQAVLADDLAIYGRILVGDNLDSHKVTSEPR